MKRNSRIIALIITAALLVGAATAFAVTRQADRTLEGHFEQPFVDRVNIAVSQTGFVFESPEEGDDLVCSFTFSIAKQEADFFARLDSLAVEGDGIKAVTYTAGNDGFTEPERVVRMSEDGEPEVLSWDIGFTVPYTKGLREYTAALRVVYTSGTDEINCDSHMKDIPLKITIRG